MKKMKNFLCVNSKSFPKSIKAVIPTIQFIALSLHSARLICECTFFEEAYSAPVQKWNSFQLCSVQFWEYKLGFFRFQHCQEILGF